LESIIQDFTCKDPKESNSLVVMNQIRSKIQDAELEIKNSIKDRLGIVIGQYNKTTYSDIVNYYEQNTNWKNNENSLHPLFESIRAEAKDQLKRKAKREIEKVISSAAGTLGASQKTSKDLIQMKFKLLCGKLDPHSAIDFLNEIYKIHANFMYSHHSMIGFHEHKHARLYFYLFYVIESKMNQSSKKAEL